MFPTQGWPAYKIIPWSRDSQRGQKKCVSVKFQMLKSHNKGHKKLSVWQPLTSFVIFEVFSPRVNGFTEGGQRPGTKRGKCRFHPFRFHPDVALTLFVVRRLIHLYKYCHRSIYWRKLLDNANCRNHLLPAFSSSPTKDLEGFILLRPFS